MYEESATDARGPRVGTDTAGQSATGGLLEQYSADIVSLEETVAGLKDEIT